jgi:rhodanese-related sulfurtransferase
MDVRKLKELMDSQAKLVILDVRNPDEVEKGAISGHIDLPLKDLGSAVFMNKLPFTKDDTIVINCQSGGRSRVAVAILRTAGFKVENLDGGYAAWTKMLDETRK